MVWGPLISAIKEGETKSRSSEKTTRSASLPTLKVPCAAFSNPMNAASGGNLRIASLTVTACSELIEGAVLPCARRWLFGRPGHHYD